MSDAESGMLASHMMAGGTLEVGDHGPAVEELQRIFGFNRPDGVFGPLTLNSLELFQGAHGLTASGVLTLTSFTTLVNMQGSGTNTAMLFDQVGTGASVNTGRSDNLPAGVGTSVKMAQSDESRVLAYKDSFISAAALYDIPPAILAAIASRETRGGQLLDEEGYSIYGGNQGFGIMQVDAGYHSPHGSPTSDEHIEQAAGIFASFRTRLANDHPEWTDAQILKAAVAAYNCGPGRINSVSGMDSLTTGKDYSNDTWVRAQYYSRFFNETLPNS
jgi:peptidoglycan hydrolase-like protein with peptidoglycan-binding domain